MPSVLCRWEVLLLCFYFYFAFLVTGDTTSSRPFSSLNPPPPFTPQTPGVSRKKYEIIQTKYTNSLCPLSNSLVNPIHINKDVDGGHNDFSSDKNDH